MSPSLPSLFCMSSPKSSILRMSGTRPATYIPSQHNPGRRRGTMECYARRQPSMAIAMYHRALADALLACCDE
jgi:hypothetical protein